MAAPKTRKQFIDYCLRALGHPVIEVNLDEDQINDRIDQSLQFFNDYHFDGVEKIFMKHQITAEDYSRRWIYCPDAVIGVTQIFPFDQSNASINIFDLRYQLRLHDLFDFTSVSYVSYEITMQHLRTLNLLFSGTPQFRFNRKLNKLYLDIDWTRDVRIGDWVIIECYRRMAPDQFIASGTYATTAGSNVVTGTGTTMDLDFMIGDIITLGNTQTTITAITSSVSMNVFPTPITTESGLTASIPGVSDVWDDRFLKLYATALMKKQWSINLKKFQNVQLPGGVMLNGQQMYDEAEAEIKDLEESMHQLNVLPGDMLLGEWLLPFLLCLGAFLT